MCMAWGSPAPAQPTGRLVPELVQNVLRSGRPHLLPAGQRPGMFRAWLGTEGVDSLMLVPFRVGHGLVAILAVQAGGRDGPEYDASTTLRLTQWLGAHRLVSDRRTAFLGSPVVIDGSGA